ncbi:MAG: outer membrane beta-barrel protein [Bacteroidales bacterium]|nr:outer membrane beta-barrel protein [Bacteroidales bacterium]
MIKKNGFFFLVFFSFIACSISAQPSIKYWDKAGYIKIGAGAVMPGVNFSDATINGMYAKNGFQIGIDGNYMIAYGLGLGLDLEYNKFVFDKTSFFQHSKAETIKSKGGYSSTKFGLNILFNVPILLASEKFVINFYGEGNAGLRGMNIPEIDLTYNEIANKYVEVSYRARANTMGYIGYSAGLQFLFSNKYGINISYNAVLPSRHSIKYSARMFDAAGNLYEQENYLHDLLDNKGVQIGFMFIIGKK